MNSIILSGLIGYITAFAGFFTGEIISYISPKNSDRFQGSLMGFTGGILIAFVCFELLPNSFSEDTFYSAILGMLAGVFVTVFLDGKISEKTYRFNKNSDKKQLKISLLIAFGIILHNFPEGIAIGSIVSASLSHGIKLCTIIAIHCIPEGLAICAPLRKSRLSFPKIILSTMVLSVPMSLGSMAGSILYGLSNSLVSFCFAFAGGVMLYITCGEILPESKEIWNGRLSTIFALFGFILGIILIAKL